MKFVLSVMCMVSGVAGAQPLSSAFDASSEGWTVETRTNPSGSFSLLSTFTPDFVPTGGDPGGHISEVDPDGNWSFFRAPASWHGDRTAFAGAQLRYSTRTDTAEEDVDLDTVLFGVCAADLAEPYGSLDFSDVLAFLSAFDAMEQGADLAEPVGVFDFSDVLAFLSLFGAGCP